MSGESEIEFTKDMRNIEELKKKKAMSIAFGEGCKYGIFGFTASAIGTLYAMRKYSYFDKYMSVSAKTSIPLMTGMFLFAANYEIFLIDISRYPEKYGLSDENVQLGKVTKMPAHHRLVNAIHDHPFILAGGLSVPLAGVIFYRQMHLTQLTISQRIMHSRVYAQAGILSIVLATMAFKQYIDKIGRYPEPED